MKAYKITIFIFAVIGVLAAVAATYPEDGITIGDTTLIFPGLGEILSGESDTEQPELSPEEIIALRAQEIRRQEEDGYLSFLRESDAAIHFPEYDSACTWLDPLYEALDGADTTLVRIVHYGDSQIEEDRITNVLRRKLQTEFGGQGVGTVPFYQSVQSHTIGQSSNREPKRYSVYWLSTFRRAGSRMYGPMGQMCVIDSAVTTTILPRTKQTGYYSAHYFNTVTLMTSSSKNIYANVKGQRLNIAPDGNSMQFTEISLPDSSTTLSVTLSGGGDIYGVMMTGKTGVNVDNMPMRGCSGTIFTGIDARQLRDYFTYTNTKLIIMQFGGNSMPYFRTEKAIDTYLQSITEQVRYMQRQAPQAKILFVGPSDMTTRIQGKMQTYPWLEEVDRRLQETVTEAGAAYWSLFKGMGGRGSMAAWVRSGLAGSDYIHFTRKGADNVAEMLYNALHAGYDYYKWRKRQNTPPEQLVPEVTMLSVDSIKEKK